MSPGKAARALGFDRRTAVLLVAAVVCFLPGVTSSFIAFDDGLYVTENARLDAAGWAGLAGLWNSHAAWAGEVVEFFPLRDTVYWCLVQLFGRTPLPFHLVSLVFHASATLAARAVLARVAPSAAFLGALLFAVHPIHVEAVTWVAGLKDPMAATFVLLAVAAFVDGKTAAPVGWLVAALLCKATAIVAPLLLVATARWSPRREAWRPVLARALGPALVAGLLGGQAFLIAWQRGVVLPPHGGSLAAHAQLALWAQVRYLQQAFVPLTHQLVYCFAPPRGWLDGRQVVSLVVLASVVTGLVVWRGAPLVRWGASWFFLNLLPVSNLVPFPALLADRYLYLAVLAPALALAVAILHVRWPIGLLLGTGLTVGFAGVTARRAGEWNVEEQLYLASDADPECAQDTSSYSTKAHFLLGATARDGALAAAAFDRALASPAFARVNQELACNVLRAANLRGLRLEPSAQTARWTDVLVSRCGAYPWAWHLAAVADLRARPAQALERARVAARLRRAPDVLVALAAAELENGLPWQAEFEEARRADARGACQVLAQWAAQVPAFAPRVGAELERCRDSFPSPGR